MKVIDLEAGIDQRELGLFSVELNNADLMTLARYLEELAGLLDSN